MRKLKIFAIGIIIAAAALLSMGAAATDSQEKQSSAAEQVILRLLHQPTAMAVEDYYGECRQYWCQEILNVQKVPESPYYEVIIQLETFIGAHNPPYGLDTITFYVGSLDTVQLISFDHQDEPD